MKTKLIYTLAALASLMFVSACKDTWIMYDTSQKGELYFTNVAPTFISFSFTTAEETTVEIPVNVMGKVTEEDRPFKVSFIPAAQGEKIETGGKSYDVYTPAREDYAIENLVIPGGKVQGVIKVTIKKTAEMKDKFAKFRLRIEENEDFLPVHADSTDMNHFITPEFMIYANAGEPVCPSWWIVAHDDVLYEWHMYLGTFYGDKFRRFLDYYHAIKDKSPTFYESCLEKYGENLDNKDIPSGFFQKDNPAVWATYVLIPLYEEFKAIQNLPESERPDDFRPENFTESGTTGGYWKNPLALLR